MDWFESPCLSVVEMQHLFSHGETECVSKTMACGVHPIDLVQQKANKRLAFCMFDILIIALLEKLWPASISVGSQCPQASSAPLSVHIITWLSQIRKFASFLWVSVLWKKGLHPHCATELLDFTFRRGVIKLWPWKFPAGLKKSEAQELGSTVLKNIKRNMCVLNPDSSGQGGGSQVDEERLQPWGGSRTM